jgi:hypothetical protein
MSAPLFRAALMLLPACLFLAIAAAGAAADDDQPKPAGVLVIDGSLVGEEPAFRIGIAAHPIDDEVRANWKIEAGRGLVIDEVLPESPAAKAGLKAGDIIVAIGDVAVGELEDVAKVVAKGEPLNLHILREGQPQAIAVKPEKQKAEGRVIVIPEEGERGEGKEPGRKPEPAHEKEANEKEEQEKEHQMHERLESLLKKLRELEAGVAKPAPVQPVPAPPTAMRPRVMAARLAAPSELPADMQVTINKRGNQPATVIVKQGKKLWRTTEGELDMLPPEARGYAARMLGKPGAGAGPGATFSIEPRGATFEWKVEPPARVPLVEPRRGEGASVKQLPGGGLQIEIREESEERKEANPKPVREGGRSEK